MAYRRFVYMNAFLLALYSGFSTVQRIAMPVQEPGDPTNYFGARRTANGWQTFMNVERKVNYPRRRSHDVQIPTLDHALGILQRFHDAINPSLDVPSLIYAACHQYARHQFSSAHLIAWAAIEALLNVIWMNLWAEVDVSSGGHTKVNRDRKKILTGRDYTASIVSQILSICQKIDDQTLTRLDQARRKRNDFAHKLVPIESGDAGKAIRLATDMITSITGVRVTSQLSMSFWL